MTPIKATLSAPDTSQPRSNSLLAWHSLLLGCIAIFVIAFTARTGALNQFVTPDELAWVDRSLDFSSDIARGRWTATLTLGVGHPGVTTMWLGTLGIRLGSMLDPTQPYPDPALKFGNLEPDTLRLLARFLTAARLAVIVTVAGNIALLFWLLDHLINRRAAFLAAGFLAVDPFAVATGSILHVDALMVVFSLNSIALLCIAIGRPRPTRWLVVSGAFAGLAMLSKSPAVILLIVAGGVLLTDGLRRRKPIRRTIRLAFAWGISATLIFCALAPSMWTAPIETLQYIASTAQTFAQTPHHVNFLLGSTDLDPGPLFYPIVIAFRSTPLMWLGLITAFFLIARAQSLADRRLRATALVFFLFALLFLGLIMISAKKLERYILPTLEGFNLVAALGLDYLLIRIFRRLTNQPVVLTNALVGLCLLSVASQYLIVYPYVFRAYTPMLGGYAAAGLVLRTGGDEGGEVGAALSTSSYRSNSIALTDVVGTAPFFDGALYVNDLNGFTHADYLLFTSRDFKLHPDLSAQWHGDRSPVMTITIQAEPFAWLYPNPWLVADQQRLLDRRQAGDALIVDDMVNLPQLATDPTVYLPSEISENDAMALLADLGATHSRIFVMHYTVSQSRAINLILRLLDTYAIKLDDWSTPLGTSRLYELPEPFTFDVQSTPLSSGSIFGERLQLDRADLVSAHVQPGQSIGVSTVWSATGGPAQGTITLSDETGHDWASGDAPVPINTSLASRILAPTPLTIPPGRYRLTLNVTDVNSGMPISIHRPDGSFGGHDWLLGTITVDPAQKPIDPASRRPPILINAAIGGLLAIGSDQPPAPVISGDPWTLSLEWALTAGLLSNLDINWLILKNGQLVYSTTMPLNSYPSSEWSAGTVLQSKYDFRLPITLPAGEYDLDFQLLDRDHQTLISAGTTHLTSLHVDSRHRDFAAPPNSEYPFDVTFGDFARLVGADFAQTDQVLTVTVWWQAEQSTRHNYTTFVQIIKPDDQIDQQFDNWQIGGDSPTSTWLPGQIIRDQYVFRRPATAYQIGLGMYNAGNGQRLPAIAANGARLTQDRVRLIR
jgi:hypothetical protein